MALPFVSRAGAPGVARPRAKVSIHGNQPIEGRVIHTIGQLGRGGAEKQLSILALALRARGWNQAVVSFSPGGYWKTILEAGGIPVFEIPSGPAKPYRWWQTNQVIRRERPELLMAWSLYTGAYTRYLVGCGRPARIQGVRGDLTIDSNTGLGSGRLRWVWPAVEGADCIISNSCWGVEVLRSISPRIPSALVIRNIVAALGRAAPAEEVETLRIAAVGTLKRLKGFDVLFQALARLRNEARPFELLVAGEGPERDSLRYLAFSLGVADCIRFLGEISDVPSLLAGAHLAVHPSRSEGLSNAVLEAMAEGLPVVATAVGGTPEMIIDGLRGLLVPPDDPPALTGAMKRLLGNPQLRGRMGQEALKWVRRHCSESAVAEAYEAAFLRAIHGMRRAQP